MEDNGMQDVLTRICEKIDSLLQEHQTVLMAIDGNCTAGKTTLAQALQKKYACNVFRMDDFFLRPEQRTPERLAQPGGNVDYERFWGEILFPLSTGKQAAYRPYDCRTGKLKDTVTVVPQRLNIIEGTYSQHPYFRDPYHFKVFLTVPPELQRQRIGLRPAMLQQRFFDEWIPMEGRYFDTFQIPRSSDLILEAIDI